MRPGVNTTSEDFQSSGGPAVDTGVAAAVYVGTSGRTDKAFLVRSHAAALRAIGERTNQNARYWDAIESFYLFGGRDLWLSRATGPDATQDSVELKDVSNEMTLTLATVAAGGDSGLYVRLVDEEGEDVPGVAAEEQHTNVAPQFHLTDESGDNFVGERFNAYKIEIIDTGDPDEPFDVQSVDDLDDGQHNHLIITLETDGSGDVTSTMDDVVTAIENATFSNRDSFTVVLEAGVLSGTIAQADVLTFTGGTDPVNDPPTSVVITVEDIDANVFAGPSDPLTTIDAITAWIEDEAATLIQVSAVGTGELPVEGRFALQNGAPDNTNVTTGSLSAALEKFVPSIGKGIQVCIPGGHTAEEWNAVLVHCHTFDRNAILAYPKTGNEEALIALAEGARDLGRAGGAFHGFVSLPLTGGGRKWVSPELVVCAKISVHDAATDGLGQNKPVAGPRRGRLNRALDLSHRWEDDEQITRLNAAGVNLIRYVGGVPQIYGWRSLTDGVTDKGWRNFGHRRLDTALKAKGDVIMGEFAFEDIDGEGTLFKDVQAALVSRLVDPYYRAGSLYGASPVDAYRVEVDSVNDADTIQDQELNAEVTVVESEYAEELNLKLIKKLITEGVA